MSRDKSQQNESELGRRVTDTNISYDPEYTDHGVDRLRQLAYNDKGATEKCEAIILKHAKIPTAETSTPINAPPEAVFATIKDVILNDDDSNPIGNTDGKTYRIEKTKDMGLLKGQAIFVLKFTESSNRIDFTLEQPTKDFKAIHGSWTLTPENNGKQTSVHVSSISEFADGRVPFLMKNLAHGTLHHKTQEQVHQKLAKVIALSEKNQRNNEAISFRPKK